MRSLSVFAPLLALTAMQSAVQAAYVVAGITPSPALGLIFATGLALFLIYWIVVDARRRHCVPCHDFGFLVGLFLPVSLVWYVLWTRGWRGIALLGAIVGLSYLPWVASVVVWLMLYGAT